MSRKFCPFLLLICIAVLLVINGCARRPVDMRQVEYFPPYEEEEKLPETRSIKPVPPPRKKTAEKNPAVSHRRITEKELRLLGERDPDLHIYRCYEILSRLNKKDRDYIREDMKKKRPLIVPKDFSAYKEWSPLPARISGTGKFPKFILVVKDIPFIGWYENGKLVGDSYICIGKMRTWTKRGLYRVKDKDPSHMSTYMNAYGDPALMPLALRVYDRVWIHAGDVVGPNCSHGCINVPLFSADKLYSWADIGAVVLITESLRDLGRDIKLGFTPDKPPSKEPVRTEEQKGSGKTAT
ncbi:MAG: L,D-transpeptidase [Desulfobacteraceae bacterium]|nr:L,D-transpeptidase [Desulfobacteraceae bacterium]